MPDVIKNIQLGGTTYPIEDPAARENASNALEVANTAKSTADTAKSVADDAKSTADTAKSTADTAKSVADDAKSTADTAQSTADTAQSTADTAKSTADTAQSTADTAQSTADTAKSTADTAQSAADTAKNVADTAKSTAETALNTANSKANITNTINSPWLRTVLSDTDNSITIVTASIQQNNIAITTAYGTGAYWTDIRLEIPSECQPATNFYSVTVTADTMINAGAITCTVISRTKEDIVVRVVNPVSGTFTFSLMIQALGY